MKKYQTSIIQEKKELDRRIKKLNKLMASEIYKGMAGNDQFILVDQKETMNRYANILRNRIRNFS